MFKKLFNFLKATQQNKIRKEALTTLAVDIDLCLELMEHPMKQQNAIRELLKAMKEICEKGNK